MAQTETDERLKDGAVIDGRYILKGLLGTGGFANVYLADHQMLGTEVALKVLHAPLASATDKQFAARFEREARVAAQMRHPNVVNVTDFGFLEDGDPYIVMEYLRGHDLDQELRVNGPMDPERLLRLMVPAVQAVGEAHKMGVVHKDLKPSNLYLVDAGSPNERLVVLDFGVARVFDDADENITQTGAFTGTPAYLPPEYIREQRVTAAFDVYQIGLIIIEAMTGRQAVEADGPMGFLLAHCMGRLSVEPEFFDNDLGVVLKRAIAVEDTERYRDCAELAEALANVAPPSPQNFTGSHFVRDVGPMSSEDVAAFADTVSSGELVGDSFITGPGRIETGPRRQPSQEVRTVEQDVPPGENSKLLYIVAGFLVIAILGALGGVLVLIGDRGEEEAATPDNGLMASTNVPEEVPVEAREEVPVDAPDEPTEVNDPVVIGIGEAGEVVQTAFVESLNEAEAMTAAKVAAKAAAAAEARDERQRARAEKSRNKERASQRVEEKKREEEKPEERKDTPLVVD